MTTLTSLTPRHTKDNAELVITHLYITDDHSLLISGHCSKCLMDVSVLVPFADLHDWAPGPMDYGIEDLAFLRSLKVCLPEPPNPTPPLSAT
jgi:hypothetical protein